jgi:hypothetical protein
MQTTIARGASDTSPRFTANMAGVFYLLTIATGLFGLVGGRLVVSGDTAATATNILAHKSAFWSGFVADVLSTACYITVTGLFYRLFKPVHGSLALVATFFSLVGCATGAVSSFFHAAPMVVLSGAQYLGPFSEEQRQALAFLFLKLNTQCSNVDLCFFAFYCLLIGVLIVKSTFLPRALGAGMLFASAGWLTFLWPPLVRTLSPFNLAPGILGEGALTVWLLVKGVNAERWKEQAGATGR